jgi:hypothetical protein
MADVHVFTSFEKGSRSRESNNPTTPERIERTAETAHMGSIIASAARLYMRASSVPSVVRSIAPSRSDD